MGSFLTKLFEAEPHHDGYGFVQLLFLGGVYGYILMFGSNMIKDGSELLLLIPSLAGVVGSIVLPVLGAVPDGAIVLFSGLGPDAQQQINVGIGALAGSTIMLLTIPWFLSIWGGRVNLDPDGNANYIRPKGKDRAGWQKLSPGSKVLGTGVNCGSAIKYSSKVMVVTLISFLIIQVPAWVGNCALEKDATPETCLTPKLSGLIGALFATALFLFYLWDQARIADIDDVKEDKIDELRKEAVKKGLVSMRGLFPEKVMDRDGKVEISADSKRFQAFLKPFFRKFDADNSGEIEKSEFSALVDSLGEKLSREESETLMKYMDKDGSGSISFKEFCDAMAELMRSDRVGSPTSVGSPSADRKKFIPGSETTPLLGPGGTRINDSKSSSKLSNEENRLPAAAMDTEGAKDEKEEEGGDDDEEPEVPEDLAHLEPKAQQRRVLWRATWQMGLGVFVVLLFSDPMVDVLGQIGDRTGIKPFYIAFVLAPLASNASELIAAFAYAKKKTEKTITISFASLIGAACMNNTFCLCIFLYLVYFKNLIWVFSAETLAILLVELIMFTFAQRRVHKTWFGFVVLALFPCSIAFVALVEAAGLD
jgi:Ca2+/Na+ antiporter